jgi:hypothetical protein
MIITAVDVVRVIVPAYDPPFVAGWLPGSGAGSGWQRGSADPHLDVGFRESANDKCENG